ncbi:MAG: 16S rRNA (cytidine(1402)-2'-O)-methyltransferase [Acetobacteraceae bacterium]|nr:16S rRNA (cytidine(1402)-2'-O)-methyltransferase [Acetobacteraceae bacterium]
MATVKRGGGSRPEAGDGRPGVLYLCGTPVGNLEDITFRALKVLKAVDLIAAEDTRRTRRLCTRYQIKTRLTSFHRFNEAKKSQDLLQLLREGRDVALVSEAGTPGISDPGELLVRLAVEAGIRVVPVPGATAVVLALVASGLPTGRFAFEGFLPRRRSQRRALLFKLKDEPRTLVFFEAPHRLIESLEDLAWALGDRPMAVAWELTKRFEEVLRGTPAQLAAAMASRPMRGEITLVVAGAEAAPEASLPGRLPGDVSRSDPGRFGPGAVITPQRLRARVEALMGEGLSRTEAVKAVARDLGLARSEVYRAALGRGRGGKARTGRTHLAPQGTDSSP